MYKGIKKKGENLKDAKLAQTRCQIFLVNPMSIRQQKELKVVEGTTCSCSCAH